MRLSFFSKNLLASSLNIVIIAVVLIAASYLIQKELMVQTLNAQARGFSSLALSQLDLADVKEAMTTHDLNSPVQQKLTKLLTSFHDKNPNIAQAYLFSTEIVNGNSSMVVASPQNILELGFKPGDSIEQSPFVLDLIKQIVQTKKTGSSEIYSDVVGSWITIAEPILDENGKVFAYFGIDQDASLVQKGQNDLLLYTGIVSAIALVLIIAIQYSLLRRLLSPIRQMHQAISQVSSGNLNVMLKAGSKDEMGELASKCNEMFQHLREIIAGVQESADKAVVSANGLAVSVEQNSQALNQISLTMQEVASGASFQEQSANEASRAMEEMTIGIQRIAETSARMADSSSEMAEQALNGNESVQKVIRQMDSIRTSVSRSASVVTALDGRSQEIVQIVDVITGIAAQTNLLALNAAIEAARAGEQGRGFAVVADEVRKLAEQSQSSASQIASLIEEIREETTQAVQAMNSGTVEVERGMKIATETGETFHEILAATQRVAQQIEDVSAVAEQLSAGSEEVAASVTESSRIAQASAEGTRGVAASSVQQMSSMKAIAANTEQLTEMAEELKRLIRKFTV